jgi:dTDP-4-amino-4,6-dideoxygalactose transaminase
LNPVSTYAFQQITDEDIKAVEAVLRSDRLTQGPAVEAFESALAEYCGSKYAVACSNGTVALWLAYRALGANRILTSPLSFVATANAARLAGAEVGFLDVDVATGNVDPMLLATLCPKVAVPVHFAGRAAELDDQRCACNTRVIEDACHALGAMDFDGCSKVGSCAHSLATVFSFHPVKPITTGEGGAITTNDEAFARELRILRDHGRSNGLMVMLGTNGRMSDIQAALGLSQLKRCDEMRDARQFLAGRYMNRIVEASLGVQIPEMVYSPECAWHLYPIRIKNGRRDEVKAALNAKGIGAQVHYNPPIHLHPYYRQLYGHKPGDFPEAEAWAAEELSLPLHAGMRVEDVSVVVEALRDALERRA